MVSEPDVSVATPAREGRPRLALLIAVLSVAAFGALLGILWARIAPADPLFVAGGKAYPQAFQPRDYISDDGLAAVMCLLAGVITAVIVIVILRRRGGADAMLAALVVSLLLGAVGAVTFWWVGTRMGYVDLAALLSNAQDGDKFSAPVRIRMPGVLVLWPAASSFVILLVAIVDWWKIGRAHV